jgi:hypothetical protein
LVKNEPVFSLVEFGGNKLGALLLAGAGGASVDPAGRPSSGPVSEWWSARFGRWAGAAADAGRFAAAHLCWNWRKHRFRRGGGCGHAPCQNDSDEAKLGRVSDVERATLVAPAPTVARFPPANGTRTAQQDNHGRAESPAPALARPVA